MSQAVSLDSGSPITPYMTDAGLEEVQQAIVPEVVPISDPADTRTAPNAVQWLGEIQSLQRQIVELKQERDSAYTSADTLRNLYESEARQRKRETEESRRAIARLQKELAALQESPALGSSQPLSRQFNAEIANIRSIRSVEQLQAQLISAKQQCQQLKAQLKEEAERHAQTRESLTAALGDAVDLLAKERG